MQLTSSLQGKKLHRKLYVVNNKYKEKGHTISLSRQLDIWLSKNYLREAYVTHNSKYRKVYFFKFIFYDINEYNFLF